MKKIVKTLDSNGIKLVTLCFKDTQTPGASMY